MADANAWRNSSPLMQLQPTQKRPETWGDLAASFGSHLASLPKAIMQGVADAATLPGRAYRGEVTQDQMIPEAINFAGNVALGGYMAPKPTGALGMSGGGKGIKAYHGSPHDFDRFSMDKIGTGEGAQAYGHGLYFAENEGVAQAYRNNLAGRGAVMGGAVDGLPDRWQMEVYQTLSKPNGPIRAAAIQELKARAPSEYAEAIDAAINSKGRMYEVRINAEPEQFLDWDKPLSQQSEAVKRSLGLDKLPQRPADAEIDALHQVAAKRGIPASQLPEWKEFERRWESAPAEQWKALGLDDPSFGGPARNPTELTGAEYVQALQNGGVDYIDRLGDRRLADSSQRLRDAGIPGIRYLDQGSRTAGDGSRNYVLFRDDIIDIVKKYGLAAAVSAYGMDAVKQATEGQTE